MRKFIVFFILFLTISFFSSVWAEEDVIVAKAGDKKITMSDFKRILSYYDTEKQKIFEQQPQRKATILKRIVQAMVVSDLARKEGFDKRADIKEQVELMVNDFIATQYLQKEIIEKIEVTDKDIELYYKANPEEFIRPEVVRARHILIKVDKSASEAERKEARIKAEDLLKRAKAGEDFSMLATEFSDDQGSKSKGGDLGYFQKGVMVPEFEAVAFSMKQGQISEIVESPFGFHIIKVEDKIESTIQPLEKVRDQVKKKVFEVLKKAKVEEFFDKIMKEAGVQLNTELFVPKM
jgi:peptidyl-prolyl cis-trans isomerase C